MRERASACACVCVRVCVSVRVHVCVCVCVCACMRVRMGVRASVRACLSLCECMSVQACVDVRESMPACVRSARVCARTRCACACRYPVWRAVNSACACLRPRTSAVARARMRRSPLAADNDNRAERTGSAQSIRRQTSAPTSPTIPSASPAQLYPLVCPSRPRPHGSASMRCVVDSCLRAHHTRRRDGRGLPV